MIPMLRAGSWGCPSQWKPKKGMLRQPWRRSSSPMHCASQAMFCRSLPPQHGLCKSFYTCIAFTKHNAKPNRHRDELTQHVCKFYALPSPLPCCHCEQSPRHACTPFAVCLPTSCIHLLLVLGTMTDLSKATCVCPLS